MEDEIKPCPGPIEIVYVIEIDCYTHYCKGCGLRNIDEGWNAGIHKDSEYICSFGSDNWCNLKAHAGRSCQLTENQRRARHLLTEITPVIAVDMIAKACSHIDASRTASSCGDAGSAESALRCAKKLLLQILGIEFKEEEL